MSSNPVRIDSGHVSSHFMRGQGDGKTPLTQKITAGGKEIFINTPVDGNGGVGNSSFSTKR
jgi:hypothetical protein